MILADLTIESDLLDYPWESLGFFLLVGGGLFLLSNALDYNPISSKSSRRKRLAPLEDSLDTAGSSQTAFARQPEAILNRPQRIDANDKRASRRRHDNPVPVLIASGTAGSEPVQGLVLNRSRGGLWLSIP